MPTAVDPPQVPAFVDTEASALFNPAFCSVVLNKACVGYASKADAAMPLTFAYLILPCALHRPTREALPRTMVASMAGWLRDTPLIRVDLANRVQTLRDITSRAILYGLGHGVLVSQDGDLRAGSLERQPRTLRPTDDWRRCLSAGAFLGKWCAGSGSDEATLLAQWGLRP
jgi:hypothetical protein